MSYNKKKGFEHLYNLAIETIEREPDFPKKLEEANLSEYDLENEVQKKSNSKIWHTVESELNDYEKPSNELREKTLIVEKTFPQNEIGYDTERLYRDYIRKIAKADDSIDTKKEFKRFKLRWDKNDLSKLFENSPQNIKEEEKIKILESYFQKLREDDIERERKIEEIEKELEVDVLRREVKKFDNEIQIKLVPQIEELIRETINDRIEPNYDVYLKVYETPGLSGILDPLQMIPTQAMDNLFHMLDTMPGGSIGIAGSRGVGKSTLIELCCGKDYLKKKINDVKVLPVFTSAPVQYESRDFILYLFSAVCERILNPNPNSVTIKYTPPELEEEADSFPAPVTGYSFLQFFKYVPRLLTLCGQISILVSLILLVLFYALLVSVSNSQFETLAKVLEIKPGTLLIWGIFLVILGYSANIFLQAISEYEKSNETSTTENNRDSENDKNSDEESEEEESEKKELADIRITAKKWLNNIKFQQTFTSGWSGALKLPIGFEGGINKAMNLTQKQMSNPEIVASFVNFLKDVTAGNKYKIIIGIDELDKIESDEAAQKFINEIKSIFNIPNCFYLISVSENAMSSFERRGLPFRDVFDSSFDDIVYVDYLDHTSAEELMKRRIIGRPMRFFYLSYCLSGGLPRDFIRSFRSLLRLKKEIQKKQKNQSDLDEPDIDFIRLCREVVKTEIRAKIRAIATSTKKIDVEPESNQFVEMIFRAEDQILNEPDFLEVSNLLKIVTELSQWQSAKTEMSNTTDQDKDDVAKCLKLEQFSKELGSYIYFLTTVMEFFDNTLEVEELKRAVEKNELEKLTEARRFIAINPRITISLLNKFRENRKNNTQRENLGIEGEQSLRQR